MGIMYIKAERGTCAIKYEKIDRNQTMRSCYLYVVVLMAQGDLHIDKVSRAFFIHGNANCTHTFLPL